MIKLIEVAIHEIVGGPVKGHPFHCCYFAICTKGMSVGGREGGREG